jgi:hypothetical protein
MCAKWQSGIYTDVFMMADVESTITQVHSNSQLYSNIHTVSPKREFTQPENIVFVYLIGL